MASSLWNFRLNPILAGTGFCRSSISSKKLRNGARLNPILAGTGFCLKVQLIIVVNGKESQSYSCWYSVLSLKSSQKQTQAKQVSILFLLVLGSVAKYSGRKDGVWTVSILFLLVLGSVLQNFKRRVYGRASQSYSCWYWVLSRSVRSFKNSCE